MCPEEGRIFPCCGRIYVDYFLRRDAFELIQPYEQSNSGLNMKTNYPEAVTENKYAEFIMGFARAANLTYSEADSGWAALSRQLSDSQREAEESQGQDRGWEMGTEYARM